MPEVADRTPEDRNRGAQIGVHPDAEGNLTLKPDDALRGLGDLLEVGADGNPAGWKLWRPDVPDGWNAYLGYSPDKMCRQNSYPLGRERPSFLVSQPVAEC